MPERYPITPTQAAVLRALREGLVELSPIEVAVRARLLPNQVRSAVKGLEQLGLAQSWSGPAEGLISLPAEGQAVSNALAVIRGTPPVGTVMQLPRTFPSFSGLFQHSPSYIEIIPD